MRDGTIQINKNIISKTASLKNDNLTRCASQNSKYWKQ